MSSIGNIHDQFGAHLFNFIKTKVNEEEDVRDIYQEVILKILNKSEQLQKAQSLKSWLFTIANNQIMDYYRVRKKADKLEAIPTGFWLESEEETGYAELEGCLHGFINRLPEDYKTIVTQSEIEGKSQKEVSESLGINYVTLRSKVQRGREKIRKMIFDACVVEKDTLGRVAGCTPKSAASACGTQQECGQ